MHTVEVDELESLFKKACKELNENDLKLLENRNPKLVSLLRNSAKKEWHLASMLDVIKFAQKREIADHVNDPPGTDRHEVVICFTDGTAIACKSDHFLVEDGSDDPTEYQLTSPEWRIYCDQFSAP